MELDRGTIYYKVIFMLYTAALIFCGGVRIVLEVWYTDWDSGFYLPAYSGVATAFGWVLGAVAAVLFLLSRLKRPRHDYPVDSGGRTLLSLLLIPLGICALVYTVFGMPEDVLQTSAWTIWITIIHIANITLGILSAVALVQAGVAGLMHPPRRPWAPIAMMPGLWQLVLLVSRFNSFSAPTFIHHQLLNILFMGFASLFYLGQARVLCGYADRSGRNYAIPSGLCASLCGFLLTVPSGISVLVNPVGLAHYGMSLSEWIFILFTSVYALAFVRSLCKSIRSV